MKFRQDYTAPPWSMCFLLCAWISFTCTLASRQIRINLSWDETKLSQKVEFKVRLKTWSQIILNKTKELVTERIYLLLGVVLFPPSGSKFTIDWFEILKCVWSKSILHILVKRFKSQRLAKSSLLVFGKVTFTGTLLMNFSLWFKLHQIFGSHWKTGGHLELIHEQENYKKILEIQPTRTHESHFPCKQHEVRL